MRDHDARWRAMRKADEQHQIGYARYLCERSLRDDPDHVTTLIRYACNLISLAQYAAAQAALDHAQPITPQEWLHLVLAQRGHLQQARGDFDGADALFMQAHALDPDDATYLIYAASVAYQRGDLSRSEALARQATTCSDGCLDEAWFNLGSCLLSTRRYIDAADCYRRALEIDPKYRQARERLSDVELILQDTSASLPPSE